MFKKHTITVLVVRVGMAPGFHSLRICARSCAFLGGTEQRRLLAAASSVLSQTNGRHSQVLVEVGTASFSNTVGSKIIRAFEISHVKKVIPNVVLLNKYLSSHDF